MPHVQQEALIVSNASQFAFNSAVELGSIGRSIVAKATVFQPAPNLLHGIQHRGVGRQLLQMQPRFKTLDGFTNRISFVHHPAVPNHNDPFGNRAHQNLQEGGRTLFVVVGIYQGLENKSQLLPTSRRPPKSTRNRYLLSMFPALLQNWSVSA